MRSGIILFAALLVIANLSVVARSQEVDYPRATPVEPAPNIKTPGPDMGNFPNGSYTLPQGWAYLEFSPFTLNGPETGTPSNYSTPFLLRYGVTDNVEFRIFSTGIQSNYGSGDNTTGFTPTAFDLKVHLWDEDKTGWVPSTALEVWLQTDLTSTAEVFDDGFQPAVNLNFDKSLPWNCSVEITIGVIGAEEFDGSQTFQETVQWSFSRNLTDDFNIFLNGYHNAIAGPGNGSGEMIGAGATWYVSDRVALWGSYNVGLNDDAPTTLSQLGLSIAY
ncbi:hypothetical protein Mal52_35250 [Symmachiella dynata]|uniref:Uncharacterized protein n=1 Tax=Symmachiella dynata TaxID=2527995 RepID=A0A517ZRC8_9PLAN|nr:transporter [Symmachiella dynata]QDU45037.1 hypothetical protein Mal52_35250 [Symmachiella dynata]